MKSIIYTLLTGTLACTVSSTIQAEEIIPLPVKLEKQAEQKGFTLNAETSLLYTDKKAKTAADLLATALKKQTGLSLTPQLSNAATSKKNSILLHLDNTFNPKVRLPKQAYSLKADENSITIQANAHAGLYYGTVTLNQLLPVASKNNPTKTWSVPVVTVQDSPSFPWRGIMLDTSRYFFDKNYMLRYIDMMAMHKLNVLHWHFIDDSGWRIEIKKYPKLVEIGSKRSKGKYYHEGHYTQEEIKEIVAYAAARNIEIVPEIEIPAHTQAALASYPHLGCFDKKLEVPDRHSISPEIYCAGKESTYTFLEDVMDEVVELFPSKFIHIGGDEAKYDRWKACPHCQAKKKKLGLKSEKQLQGYMTRRIETYLEKKGKTIIGWDEILATGITNKSGIMTWHKPSTAVKGAKRGNPVVMSLVPHTYFDTPESKLPGEPPCATWTAPVTLSKAYNWHPVPPELNAEAAKNILGPNGCVWTDRFLHDREQLQDLQWQGTAKSEAYVDYLTLPRMAALAEVGWTPKNQRDFADFKNRMKVQYHRYENKGYNYRIPTPTLEIKRDAKKTLHVSGEAPVRGASVHYTLDGSEPHKNSPKLTTKITATPEAVFKAATFLENGKNSLTYTYQDALNKYAKHGTLIGEWKSGQIAKEKAKEATFDATGIIDANGTYKITFLYTGGAEKLCIDSVKILRNDRDLMGEDKHQGYTGGEHKNNVYTITIEGYETGASFKVKAQIYGHEGNDSNGVVLIKKQ